MGKKSKRRTKLSFQDHVLEEESISTPTLTKKPSVLIQSKQIDYQSLLQDFEKNLPIIKQQINEKYELSLLRLYIYTSKYQKEAIFWKIAGRKKYKKRFNAIINKLIDQDTHKEIKQKNEEIGRITKNFEPNLSVYKSLGIEIEPSKFPSNVVSALKMRGFNILDKTNK